MPTLHFISHTHWDREWHEPFQVFRIKLMQAIDRALDLLASEPDYKFFMLDGQTVVLEDYVELAPARAAELRAHIENGRILVGPWYILPDEFLVSGEALIRNLLRGTRIANAWGKRMDVGYIPDPFGHISQLPQLFRGFGIGAAMFRRGLADEPTELWWEGADGTRVLATYLRDGYDNAAWLARDPQKFVEDLQRLIDALAPYAVTAHMLMMHGTDHMQPWAGLPQLLRAAEQQIPGVRILHSNLPAYVHAVEQALNGKELLIVKGELRNPKRHHLLPGVTSTRMWIRQRNARAQTLLEAWAEPCAAVAMNLTRPQGARLQDWRPQLQLAWKYLLHNHPHDSICGCSIDQVHREMAPRFDWVEQIGGDVVKNALPLLVCALDTQLPIGRSGDRAIGQSGTQPPTFSHAVAIVIFNPAPGPRADAVTAQVDLPNGWGKYRMVDAQGSVVPFVELGRHQEEYFSVTATADDLHWMFGAAQNGRVDDYILRDFTFHVEGDQVYVDISASSQGEQDMPRLQAQVAELRKLVTDPAYRLFHARMHSLLKVDVTLFARAVPAYGYKTFWLVPATTAAPQQEVSHTLHILENEFFHIQPNAHDGTLTITDKTSGAVYAGAHRFVDGGDRGDLYNYCRPERDTLVDKPAAAPLIEMLENNAVRQILRIRSLLHVPASLAPTRERRADATVNLPISTVITLYAGARRIDFHTQVENAARDHRLRVEFPTPLHTARALAGQAFDIVTRGLDLEPATPEWIELPRPEKPMQQFVAVEDGERGLALASRGLPEYEVRSDGLPVASGVTLALTLLRCVGWLSRPDLPNRRGDAGPEKQTPDAQELGAHFFEYALIPFSANAGGFRAAQYEALAFNAPLRAVATDAHAGELAASASWFEVSHPDFVLTAVKPPEEGAGLIARGFNTGDSALDVRVKPFRNFAHVKQVNLNEAELRALEWNEAGAVEFEVKPREIVTLRFED